MFTRDLKRSQQAIDRLDGGYPWVNTIQVAYDELPFGGTKHSGFGKEHGVEVLDFYTEQKSVVVAGVFRPAPPPCAGPAGSPPGGRIGPGRATHSPPRRGRRRPP